MWYLVRMNRKALRFFFGNKKLKYDVAHISLPSGWTCPFAKDCCSKCCPKTGKLIQTGKEFRCYSASEECAFPPVRETRWHNFNLLKGRSTEEMVDIIKVSLPRALIVRLHVGGDFFSQSYFDAWLRVAKDRPQTLFYAYTKSLPFWVKRLGRIPQNFRLIASYGGKRDELISKYNLRSSRVVFSKVEAKRLGLRIDTDDTIAQKGEENFSTLVHGTGSVGSKQSKLHWLKIKKARVLKKSLTMAK